MSMLCDITENKTPSKIFDTFLEANLFFDFFFLLHLAWSTLFW